MQTTRAAMDRLRAEYWEMPGLRLTANEVQLLCGIESTVCQAALDALVETRFLRVTANGHYLRLRAGELPTPPPAKIALATPKRFLKAS